jgi:hypothetical protein
MWGASRQAPTLNEPAHLVAGVSHLTFGTFDLYRVNPPLVRMVAALPVLAAGYKADWSSFSRAPGARPVFAMGENFARANDRRFMWLLSLARWACIPFAIIGAWTCYQWTRELAGVRGGLTALALWCGSPQILGLGQLITPDVPASALGLLACYAFWRWLRRPTWAQTLLTGFLLGIAQLTKTTLLVFFLIWPLTWLVARSGRRATLSPQRWWAELGKLGVAMLTGVYALNLGYAFEGSFQPLHRYQFVSSLFTGTDDTMAGPNATGVAGAATANRFAGSSLGDLPVPFPESYVLGLDIQQRDFERFGRPSYLRGTFRDDGWWYYYLYGLTVKVPLSFWGLAVVAVILRFRVPVGSNNCDAEFLLLTVPAVVLIVASTKHGFSHHMRYILPCFPFAFCWIAASLARAAPAVVPPSGSIVSGRYVRGLTVFLIVSFWTSSMMVFPHSLSYFNMLAGGPFGGPRHLLGSNVDWGQDLLFLQEKLSRLESHEPVFLAYYGGSHPRQCGIIGTRSMRTAVAHHAMSRRLSAGYYAISVNLLFGDPRPARSGDEADARVPDEVRDALSSLTRYDSAGYSIYLYYVPP